MNASDVVSCALTTLFASAAIRGLWHGLRPRTSGWHGRVDHLLHAAMAMAMAAMPWSWGQTLLGTQQAVFFATAAVWSPLSALVHGRTSPVVRWGSAISRLPITAGMVAMVWMTWPSPAGSPEMVADGRQAMSHATHAADSMGGLTAGVTALLAACMLACSLWSLTRAMPSMVRTRAFDAGSQDPYRHFWEGSTAMGTAIMLLLTH
ncbi:DUF5134 domain-containing protein [Streptomyces sp. NPDC127036]|uniref:DUF5134 domain-containing protein n=1 Tax=Streptomyces sp. NPDC127036 TaxID=3347112 RepID=UPI003656D722